MLGGGRLRVPKKRVVGPPSSAGGIQRRWPSDALAYVEDAREVERRGVEAEGQRGCSETVDGGGGEEIAIPAVGGRVDSVCVFVRGVRR